MDEIKQPSLRSDSSGASDESEKDESVSRDSSDGDDECGRMLGASAHAGFEAEGSRQVSAGIESDFGVVLAEERAYLQKQLQSRGTEDSEERFSVALSGGGVRASAFGAGLLWRLAELGLMKNVNYISAVSGGSYTAGSFASFLAAMGPAPANADVDSWYRKAVARMLCRMQENTPYLSRDLGKSPWSFPTDGSSCLPRIFDIPILLVVFSVIFVGNKLYLLLLVFIPLAEFIELQYGSNMRAVFCAKNTDEMDFILPIPFGQTIDWRIKAKMLWGFVILTFCVWLLGNSPFLKPKTRHDVSGSRWPKQLRRNNRFLLYRSTHAAIIRFFLAMLASTVLVNGPVWLRLMRYSYFTYGETVRACHCERYVESLHQHTLYCNQLDVVDIAETYGYGMVDGKLCNASLLEHVYSLNGTESYLRRSPWSNATSHLYVKWSRAKVDTPGYPIFLLVLLFIAGVTLLCLPFTPVVFLWMLQIIGPLFAFGTLLFYVQWRVLGEVTGESLFFENSGIKADEDFMLSTTNWIIVLDIAILFLERRSRSLMHAFYARSLRRAYFAEGKDWKWADLRGTPLCPLLLFGATANEYMRPGDKVPFSDFTLTALRGGGGRLGYAPTPSKRSLSRCSALSGGAVDGVLLAKHDTLYVRFWLEMFGFHMGDALTLRPDSGLTFGPCGPSGVFVVAYLLFFGAAALNRGSGVTRCAAADILLDASFVVWMTVVGLSFFCYKRCLAPLMQSNMIRTIHQMSQFYHISEDAPATVHVSDGGVLDNTGVVPLLRRRERKIVAAYAGNETKNQFKCLKKVQQVMFDEQLGSFFDPQDPRRNISETLDLFISDPSRNVIHLGIKYGWGRCEGIGHLYIIPLGANIPPNITRRPRVHAKPLLTEDEVMGRQISVSSSDVGDLADTDLGGCCCDCCHASGLNCGPKFPRMPTYNQWLTPLVFSHLVRHGHELAEEAALAVAGASRESP